MLSGFTSRLLAALPSQCLVCYAWPSQPVCEACVSRFAQPQSRCPTCALPVPAGVRQCGVCIKQAPPLDACLAAVTYAFPWSDLIVGFKFNNNPGRASAFALLLRSTPWVEPALDAADVVVPMPLSPERLKSRGFNQALLLARLLAPEKTDARLLLRIKDTPPQSSLKRAERLDSVNDAFAVEPLQLSKLKGARVVLVDDVMTSGASLFAAARALRSAGAAHITGLVIARTE
ncbi:MAG: ComF family protein [Rhodoferax sp.]|uniref:ComF family protein n=1 Tax=Rhodoferax sp. TaxID=50421 RepID=UPI003017275C